MRSGWASRERTEGVDVFPLIYASGRAEPISNVFLPFTPVKYANLTKQDSVRVEQNSRAREGGNFSQPCAENFQGAKYRVAHLLVDKVMLTSVPYHTQGNLKSTRKARWSPFLSLYGRQFRRSSVDRITLCDRLTYAMNVDMSKGAACGSGRSGRMGEIGGSTYVMPHNFRRFT